MAFQKILLVLIVFWGCETGFGQDPNLCKDAKAKGYKVKCPAWNDPQCGDTCEWYESFPCDDLAEGTCGAGIKRELRARDCTYLDEEKNRNEKCIDSQERRDKCKLQCGKNGKYNELLDFCECKENWDGTCCDKKIAACTNPVMKEGEIDRSTAYVGKGNRCDGALRPTWYRFNSPAGNLIPNECVPQGSCNTAVPFWLNGTHPLPKDGVVDRWACGTQSGDCCKHKLKIKVRNCVDYMAYYLVPTQGCMKAYCVGSHEKCPDGESSDTGFQPGCSNDFPDIKVTPVVGYHVNEQDSNKVYLTCTAAHAQAANYLWKAQWFFDDEPGPIQTQDDNDKNPQPKFFLPTSAWKSKMGTNAECTIVAKRRNGKGTWSQSNIRSKEYYLGIVIQEKEVNVKEGDTAHVTLRPNLPVRCHKDDEDGDQCHLVMSLSMDPTAKGPKCPGKPAEISQVIFHGDMETRCGYKDISHTNWHMPSKIQIKPKLDIQLDGMQTRTLRLRVNEQGTSIPDFWLGYILPTVRINIIDADDRGTCTLVNDPHITTFDKRYYDFHDRPNRHGDRNVFVVYKHIKESEEVQARFFLCNGNIYCICGVAMRAGSSTVVFDRCRTAPNLIPELNYKVKDAVTDPSMRVFKHNSGTAYHVFLPTGTQVKVFAEGGGVQMRIEIKSSIEGKDKSVGLCGNNNGKPEDDIQTSKGKVVCPFMNHWYRCEDEEFRTSWHVVDAESIFQGKVPPHNPGEHLEEIYCDCVSEPGHQGYEDCDYHKRYEPCDDGFEVFKPTKGYTKEQFPWLKAYRAPQEANPEYAKIASTMEKQYYSAWAADTWTDDKAKEYCTKELFSSDAVTACLNEVPNQNYTNNIEACTLDLVLTGSTEFAAAHLENVKSMCHQELKMNLDLWEPRAEDEEAEEEQHIAGPPLWLTENLCPNECNGNGACIDGKCTCKKGYASYDCSMKVDEVPVVKGVVSSSIPCDRSSQDCSTVALEGLKYLEGPALTCHYYKDDGADGQYFYSGAAQAPQVTTGPGNLYSLWVVQCEVPEELSIPVSAQTTLYKLQLAVSNDGNQQSDRAFYGSYDARCENCVNKTCERKIDSCIISSQCYGYGEKNPEDPEKVCNSVLDGFSWSLESTLTSPTTPATTTTPTTTTPSGDDIVCNGKPNEVSIHRDPKNCNMYYVCEGDRKHHMPCPIGLAFSEAKGTCVEPHLVPGCG